MKLRGFADRSHRETNATEGEATLSTKGANERSKTESNQCRYKRVPSAQERRRCNAWVPQAIAPKKGCMNRVSPVILEALSPSWKSRIRGK